MVTTYNQRVFLDNHRRDYSDHHSQFLAAQKDFDLVVY